MAFRCKDTHVFPAHFTMCDKEDIYFFEANTKCISSNVLKISVISRVRSKSEIADIFNTWDEIFWYLPKKVNFLFIFSVNGKNLTLFIVISR